MKKLIMICVAAIIALSMCISGYAAVGSFVSSPSGNKAPELISATNASEECTAEVVITAYADRDELSEENRKKIEEVYAMIMGAKDVTHLHDAIETYAEQYGIDPTLLAVSDLFDISATECNGHEDHGHFDIVLKADTLENFFCLLHYYNDEWRIVDNAEITNNGTHLEFDEDEFSPFAIVVYTGEWNGLGDVTDDATDTNDTGSVDTDANEGEDESNATPIIIAAVAGVVVAGGATAATLVYKSKSKAKK